MRTASTEPDAERPLPDTSSATTRFDDTSVRRLVWIALSATLVIVTALAVWQLRTGARSALALPVFGTVPPFALVERDGRPVTAADLRNHVWIASFEFTRCAGMCPGLTTTLAALMRRIGGTADNGIRAVTFTVDPAHDDPDTLRRYAERYGADPVRWLFLTGEHDAIERLVRDGFRLSIAELPPGEREQSPEPITHSDRFVLVDRDLRIRGYYHGTDPESVTHLEADLELLAGSR